MKKIEELLYLKKFKRYKCINSPTWFTFAAKLMTPDCASFLTHRLRIVTSHTDFSHFEGSVQKAI